MSKIIKRNSLEDFCQLFRQTNNDINLVYYLIVGAQENSFFLFLQIFVHGTDSKNIIVINVENTGRTELSMRLQISFLGSIVCYYLKGISQLSPSEKSSWIKFLKDYKGPHRLIAVLSDNSFIDAPENTIVIPDIIQNNEIILLGQLVLNTYAQKNFVKLASLLMQKHKKVSFHHCVTVLLYAHTISPTMIDAFNFQYLSLLCTQDSSLFQLAELFLTKNIRFFNQWNDIFSFYSVQFWISFWLDQVFRTIMYIYYKKNKFETVAKKISFRLPFFIINKGWTTLDSNQLKSLHNSLLYFDCQIKQGISEQNIHTILTNFFLSL